MQVYDTLITGRDRDRHKIETLFLLRDTTETHSLNGKKTYLMVLIQINISVKWTLWVPGSMIKMLMLHDFLCIKMPIAQPGKSVDGFSLKLGKQL